MEEASSIGLMALFMRESGDKVIIWSKLVDLACGRGRLIHSDGDVFIG